MLSNHWIVKDIFLDMLQTPHHSSPDDEQDVTANLTRCLGVAKRFRKKSMTSHVLLAARGSEKKITKVRVCAVEGFEPDEHRGPDLWCIVWIC